MKYITKFIGFDVSKEKIAVAIADEGREDPRYWGMIPHTPEAVRKFIKKMSDVSQIEVCYEAGPTGYELYRWLTGMKVQCKVVAPSMIPKRMGDQIKTDRRDALRLAKLLRAGELTAVYVPDQDDEALRDLVRAREDAKKDVQAARQRVVSFLLRQQKFPPAGIKTRWTKVYREWLDSLKWENDMQRIVFEEYLQAVREGEGRVKRLEEVMAKRVLQTKHAKLIQALQALRGIQLLTAVTIAAEICTFLRFKSAKNLMSYLGLVPRERSSGATTRRGGITKTGSSRLRRVLTESSWSYRYKPAVKSSLRKRLEGQSARIQEISWKAQNRLHDRYMHLLRQGKNKNAVITAIARELTGFIWAIGQEVEQEAVAA